MKKMAAASATQKKASVRPKLFYRIQEVSRMTGLKPYVLRYWETEFKALAPEKDRADQRRYRPEDIEVVLAIRKLLYEDRFTIEGARKRLAGELRRRKEERSPKARARKQAVQAGIDAPSLFSEAMRPVRDPKLDQSLRHLKDEVRDLLNLLSA